MEVTATTASFFFRPETGSSSGLYSSLEKEFMVPNQIKLDRLTCDSREGHKNEKAFEYCWKIVQETAQQEREKANTKVFSDVAAFFEEALSLPSEQNIHKNHQNLELGFEQRFDELPVAVIVAGINMSDNEQSLRNLSAYLTSNVGNCTSDHYKCRTMKKVTTYVTMIGPNDCTSGAHAINSIAYQILEYDHDRRKGTEDLLNINDTEISEPMDMNVSTMHKSVRASTKEDSRRSEFKHLSRQKRRRVADFDRAWLTPVKKIEIWYESLLAQHKLDIDKDDSGPVVVVMILDAESVPEEALNTVINTCREFYKTNGMKICMVLGMCGRSSGAHELLSREQTSRLELRNFNTVATKVVVQNLIAKLIIECGLPVTLEDRIVTDLYDHYLSNEMSIHKFILALKLVLMLHFSDNEAAFICCLTERLNPTETVIELDEDTVDFINVKVLKTTKEEKLKRKHINYKLTECQNSRRRIRPFIFRCVLRACSVLGLYSKKSKVEIFLDFLSACNEERIKKKLKQPVMDGLSSMVKHRCKYASLETLRNLAEAWDNECDILNTDDIYFEKGNLLDKINDASLRNENERRNDLSAPENKVAKRLQAKKKQRAEALQSAQPIEFRIKEKACNTLLQWWERLLQAWMKRPTTPLSEALVCKSNKNNREMEICNQIPRLAVYKALVNPHSVLKCTCCSERKVKMKEEAYPTLPDTAIAFKLFNYHFRKSGAQYRISLFDWYQEFKSSVTSKVHSSARRAKSKKVSSTVKNDECEENGPTDNDAELVMKARFVQAINELQMMGLFKESRKRDAVLSLMKFPK